jgi:hypothetical protein
MPVLVKDAWSPQKLAHLKIKMITNVIFRRGWEIIRLKQLVLAQGNGKCY